MSRITISKPGNNKKRKLSQITINLSDDDPHDAANRQFNEQENKQDHKQDLSKHIKSAKKLKLNNPINKLNKPINKPINKAINKPINKPTSKPINKQPIKNLKSLSSPKSNKIKTTTTSIPLTSATKQSLSSDIKQGSPKLSQKQKIQEKTSSQKTQQTTTVKEKKNLQQKIKTKTKTNANALQPVAQSSSLSSSTSSSSASSSSSRTQHPPGNRVRITKKSVTNSVVFTDDFPEGISGIENLKILKKKLKQEKRKRDSDEKNDEGEDVDKLIGSKVKVKKPKKEQSVKIKSLLKIKQAKLKLRKKLKYPKFVSFSLPHQEQEHEHEQDQTHQEDKEDKEDKENEEDQDQEEQEEHKEQRDIDESEFESESVFEQPKQHHQPHQQSPQQSSHRHFPHIPVPPHLRRYTSNSDHFYLPLTLSLAPDQIKACDSGFKFDHISQNQSKRKKFLDFYHRNGFVVVKNVFDSSVILFQLREWLAAVVNVEGREQLHEQPREQEHSQGDYKSKQILQQTQTQTSTRISPSTSTSTSTSTSFTPTSTLPLSLPIAPDYSNPNFNNVQLHLPLTLIPSRVRYDDNSNCQISAGCGAFCLTSRKLMDNACIGWLMRVVLQTSSIVAIAGAPHIRPVLRLENEETLNIYSQLLFEFWKNKDNHNNDHNNNDDLDHDDYNNDEHSERFDNKRKHLDETDIANVIDKCILPNVKPDDNPITFSFDFPRASSKQQQRQQQPKQAQQKQHKETKTVKQPETHVCVYSILTASDFNGGGIVLFPGSHNLTNDQSFIIQEEQKLAQQSFHQKGFNQKSTTITNKDSKLDKRDTNSRISFNVRLINDDNTDADDKDIPKAIKITKLGDIGRNDSDTDDTNATDDDAEYSGYEGYDYEMKSKLISHPLHSIHSVHPVHPIHPLLQHLLDNTQATFIQAEVGSVILVNPRTACCSAFPAIFSELDLNASLLNKIRDNRAKQTTPTKVVDTASGDTSSSSTSSTFSTFSTSSTSASPTSPTSPLSPSHNTTLTQTPTQTLTQILTQQFNKCIEPFISCPLLACNVSYLPRDTKLNIPLAFAKFTTLPLLVTTPNAENKQRKFVDTNSKLFTYLLGDQGEQENINQVNQECQENKHIFQKKQTGKQSILKAPSSTSSTSSTSSSLTSLTSSPSMPLISNQLTFPTFCLLHGLDPSQVFGIPSLTLDAVNQAKDSTPCDDLIETHKQLLQI